MRVITAAHPELIRELLATRSHSLGEPGRTQEGVIRSRSINNRDERPSPACDGHTRAPGRRRDLAAVDAVQRIRRAHHSNLGPDAKPIAAM